MMRATSQPPLAVEAEAFWPSSDLQAEPLWLDEDRPWNASFVEHYMSRYSAPGDLVVDPFAAQPILARAAASSQRRILLSHYSPATVLAISAAAAPPPPAAVDAAFSAVADAPRRGRTLADYVRALYETICPECAQLQSAAYFVWDRNAGEPVEKGYACPHCQNAGLAAVDMADITLASGLEVRGAAYWGLLSRLVAPGDDQTDAARGLLNLYTPRALVAISELLTAVEQRLRDPDERRAGLAMVLHAMQRCISLQEPPEVLDLSMRLQAPAQLQLPARFIEHNAWLAFENAHKLLRQRPHTFLRQPADLTGLLSTHGRGAALLLASSVQNLTQQLEPECVTLVLSSPPPLSAALYALQFLWSGWLYGRKTASPLKGMLAVETPTWDWYARVLAVALRSVRRLLRRDGHVVLACRGPSARLPLALLHAASSAGLRLVAQATQAPLMQRDGELAWQLTFAVRGPAQTIVPVLPSGASLRQAAHDAVLDLVYLRGEPVPVPLANSAISARWEMGDLLSLTGDSEEANRKPVTYLVQQSRLALTPEMPPAGLRYLSDAEEQALPQWAPEQLGPAPLADRVELAVAELLAQRAWPRADLLAQVYARFPGWETPDNALLAACLESYANLEDGQLTLRSEDQPAERSRERGEILLRLYALGHRLGYQVWVAAGEQVAAKGLVPLGQGEPADSAQWAPAGLVWHIDGKPVHAFAPAFHAVLRPWLHHPPDALGDCPRHVVVPGGRSGLLAFKLERTPAWRARLAESGWEFVKFRHVRRLAALPDLSRSGFRARIGIDPIVRLPGSQLALFENSGEGGTYAD